MTWRAAMGTLFGVAAISSACGRASRSRDARADEGIAIVTLPAPTTSGSVNLERALARRRSQRAFAARPLSDDEIGQLLWAAQGVTDGQGHRTAPSAGALYPLEVYVVTPQAVFRYRPPTHDLQRVRAGDLRGALAKAAYDQDAVGDAAIDVVIAGVMSRTRAKYGARAERFVTLEAGHAGQNVLLEATALDLGAVPIGAFDDDEVRAVIGASDEETPLYVLAVGHPAP